MSNLPQSMDAGIGAARPMHDDLFLRDLARRIMDRALDRRNAGLRLPAVEVGALVRDSDLDISHPAVSRIIARRATAGPTTPRKQPMGAARGSCGNQGACWRLQR